MLLLLLLEYKQVLLLLLSKVSYVQRMERRVSLWPGVGPSGQSQLLQPVEHAE